MRHTPALRARPWIVAALLVLAATGCRVPLPARPSGAAPGAAPVVGPTPAIPMRLIYAATEYSAGGSSDTVVELRVILDNTAREASATDSTTILWDPAFAQSFTFLYSEPPAWRMRTDERGWGVVDTAGVVPGTYGTFKIYFAASEGDVVEPHIVVVANGDAVLGETVALPSHELTNLIVAEQTAFERGPLAAAADRVGFLPTDARSAFHFALLLGVLLAMATLGGTAAAHRASMR